MIKKIMAFFILRTITKSEPYKRMDAAEAGTFAAESVKTMMQVVEKPHQADVFKQIPRRLGTHTKVKTVYVDVEKEFGVPNTTLGIEILDLQKRCGGLRETVLSDDVIKYALNHALNELTGKEQ